MSPQLENSPGLLPYVFWKRGVTNGLEKSVLCDNVILGLPAAPFFVVIRIAPLAALLP